LDGPGLGELGCAGGQLRGVDGDVLAVEECADGFGDGQAAADPPLDIGAVLSDRVPLGGGVPGAEAEAGAPAGDDVKGGDVGGEQDRLADAGVGDVGAEADGRGDGRCGGESDEGRSGGAGVVRGEKGIEPGGLALLRQMEPRMRV